MTKENSLLTYAGSLEFEKVLAAVAEYAVSPTAKKAIAETVPLSELAQAQHEMDCCSELCELLRIRTAPGIYAAEGIPEIAMRAKKGGILSMGELLLVRSMLKNARVLLAWFSNPNYEMFAIGERFYRLFEDSALEQDIHACILSESEMSSEASRELADIRRKIAREESGIREKLESIIRSGNAGGNEVLQDAIVTMRGGRFVVPVKSEYKNHFDGLVHDISSSGSTFFVEPAAVVEANTRIMQLKADEVKEIERILCVFSARVAGISDLLHGSADAFHEIDVLLAKAHYALSMRAEKPLLNDEGRITLKHARHPLIPAETVVPVDLSLGGDYIQLVITGPNTGGKTVALKTIGLLSLMAMSGIPVPADEGSELCVFRKVLVDIGDEQSIEQSLSTFSGHVKTISEILKQADRNSLVLLDELGSGTDPAEGAALAVAILERLLQIGCCTAATTHYGEIKLYAFETAGVQNASCEFDIQTISPTYRVIIGLPGSSNALLIGERLGLEKSVLDAARAHLSSETRHFEAVLSDIEEIKSEAANHLAQAEEKLKEANSELEAARKEREKLISQGEKELELARNRARQLSADVTASAHRLFDELKKLEKGRNAAAAARAREIARRDAVRIEEMAPEYEQNHTEELEPVRSVKKGDTVYIARLGQTAVVQYEPDKNGLVEVLSGALKSRVKLSDLRWPKKRTNVERKKSYSGSLHTVQTEKRSGKNEINLIGMDTEQGVLELESFLDSALLSHLHTVYVIHGKGTGALRSAVHARLKTLKQVKAFRLGKYGEGESGVTIVELK